METIANRSKRIAALAGGAAASAAARFAPPRQRRASLEGSGDMRATRLFALTVAVLAACLAAGAFTGSASAVPPCWPDCPEPAKPSHDPYGAKDAVIREYGASPGYLFRGFAADPDAPTAPIQVRIDILSPYPKSYTVTADRYRSGLSAPIGPYHGFEARVPYLEVGRFVPYSVGEGCVYALNVLEGEDQLLGCELLWFNS